jgi:hypothetical protein
MYVKSPFILYLMNIFQSNGTVDLSFFSPDCFHFSQFGHALVAKHTWNTMLQPVGSKSTNVSLSPHMPQPPLACPDHVCIFC